MGADRSNSRQRPCLVRYLAPQRGTGERHRSGRLQGGEGRLPGLSRPSGRRPRIAPPSGISRSFHRWSFSFEFTQHIPPKGSHLFRYYGWYSNKSRGMRKKPAAEAAGESPAAEGASPGRSSQSWAMLIKRVYEVDPLSCPECGSQMRVVAFIEPPQRDVIEESCAGTRAERWSVACGARQKQERRRLVPSGMVWPLPKIPTARPTK